MDRKTVWRQWMGVLIGVLAWLAIAQGQTVYTQGADLHVGNHLYVTGDGSLADVSAGDMSVDDLEVDGYLGLYSAPWGFFTNLIATTIIQSEDDIGASGDLAVGGKVYSFGGYDPPYVLYDRQTRDEIVEKVKKEVAPEKQDGAVLFFNKDTHQLETYVPAEGKFYNLNGTVVQALQAVVAPARQYRPSYYLDRDSGQVKSFPKAVSNKYKLKSGYRLNEATGQFIDTHSGQVVAREQAVEFYNAAEQTFYDLRGRAVRSERDQKPVEYATQYYFDKQTGEVKQMRRPVRQTYTLREGFHFDKKSGRFTEEATGKTVTAQEALVQKQQ
jgi:hypothetical protein